MTGVDVDPAVADAVADGACPVENESGLAPLTERLVADGALAATTDGVNHRVSVLGRGRARARDDYDRSVARTDTGTSPALRTAASSASEKRTSVAVSSNSSPVWDPLSRWTPASPHRRLLTRGNELPGPPVRVLMTDCLCQQRPQVPPQTGEHGPNRPSVVRLLQGLNTAYWW